MDRYGPASTMTAQETDAAPAAVLCKVLSLLDGRGIAWCISHGYEGLPHSWGADLDIVIERSVSAAGLHSLLDSHAEEIGARTVGQRGMFVTLAIAQTAGPPQFLMLDFAHDVTCGRHLLYRGETVLARRRRMGNIWIPAPGTAFDIIVARAVLKAMSPPDDWTGLTAHFLADPADTRSVVEQRWPQADARMILAAAVSGNWKPVTSDFAGLRRRLAWRSFTQSPAGVVGSIIREQAARLGRLLRPRGLHVALLGPDGAGKSSVIAALEQALAPLFARSEVRGFAPSLRQLLRRGPADTSTPHALAPRSPAASLLRACYWFICGLLSHATLRWAKARNTLILNDRHFVDILVDPVRYRYGGPRWPLKLIWKTMAKPDFVILLHGPAEVLQARKKELTVAETARQCEAYLGLVHRISHGYVIDATQPQDAVASAICDILMRKQGPVTRG